MSVELLITSRYFSCVTTSKELGWPSHPSSKGTYLTRVPQGNRNRNLNHPRQSIRVVPSEARRVRAQHRGAEARKTTPEPAVSE